MEDLHKLIIPGCALAGMGVTLTIEMSNGFNHPHNRFIRLGGRLKSIREKLGDSLAEVSGAVEIEHNLLEKFENGEQRPNEEILLLLISHFDVHDDEATKLWELANYDDKQDEQSKALTTMPIDTRIIYTDMVHVVVSQYGVIMNFMQNGGPNQQIAVARVGMSKEHAKSVLEVLQNTLAQSDIVQVPKSLPLPEAKEQKTD